MAQESFLLDAYFARQQSKRRISESNKRKDIDLAFKTSPPDPQLLNFSQYPNSNQRSSNIIEIGHEEQFLFTQSEFSSSYDEQAEEIIIKK